MKIPVFLPVTREFGFRDEFAQDCLLQRRVCEPSVPAPKLRVQTLQQNFTRQPGTKDPVLAAGISGKNQNSGLPVVHLFELCGEPVCF